LKIIPRVNGQFPLSEPSTFAAPSANISASNASSHNALSLPRSSPVQFDQSQCGFCQRNGARVCAAHFQRNMPLTFTRCEGGRLPSRVAPISNPANRVIPEAEQSEAIRNP